MDWERLIGVKLFSIGAGVLLAIAAILAVVLSIEAGIVTPPVRFAILAAVGAILVVGSELPFARRYAVTSQPLAAGGVVTLFATFYAGYRLWDLYPPLVAFGLLALVTTTAVLLSIRRSSRVIAVLGLLGGFATPILVSTGEDRPLSLFGYLLLLNVALAVVSYRRRWPLLPWLSLACTALYEAGWVGRYVDAARVPLALGIFVVLALAGFVALRLSSGGIEGPLRRGAAAAAIPPAVLALYLAVNTGVAAPWPLLLGFVALLSAGLAVVAAWQGPEWLHLAGAGFAVVTSAACLSRAPDDAGPLLLASGSILAVFVAGPFLLARLGRPLRAEGRLGALAAPVLAGWALLAPSLASRWPIALVVLAIAAAGLAALAARDGPEWLHPAGAAVTLAGVGLHLTAHFTESNWPRLALFTAVLALPYLLAPLALARWGRDLRGAGRHASLAAPLLLVVFVRAAPADSAGAPLAFLAPLVAFAAVCSLWAVLRADARAHAISSALALVATAVWSGCHLDASRLYPALLTYLALGAILLGAPLWAERRGRPLSGDLTPPLLVGALLLLAFLARPIAGAALGALVGLTALAALLQAALFREAVRGRHPLLAIGGVVVGFVELALWAVTGLASAILPLLVAATVLAAVALTGAALVAPRVEGRAAPIFRGAPFLALAGHAFVLVVAIRRDLAFPPAPWLAVLGVLDLGFAVAALLRRRGGLAVGPAAATLVVLLAHAGEFGSDGSAALVGCSAALAAAALFLAIYLVARRTGAAPASGLGGFGAAAVIALHGAQLLLLLFGGDLSLALVLPAHLGLVCGLLLVAWVSEVEALTLSSAALAGTAALLLCVVHDSRGGGYGPGPALAVATAVWLAALAYPLLRRERGRGERLPFVATALASGIYLLGARSALLALGAGPFIGALPVIEAALLVPHLVLLLRIGPPSPMDERRLVLVAASILALVTVAVPLQFDKQWWTLGWALLAAALAWLWRRLPHRSLLLWTTALLGASFVRLVPFFNVWIFGYHPRAERPIWNWFLYTYLVAAAAHLLASYWLAGGHDRPWRRGPRLSSLAGTSGAVLLFLLVNIEIADYWSPAGAPILFRFSAGLAPDLSYTMGWAVFAVGLLVAGVVLRSRAVRIAAIALLTVTVIKGFWHDLGHLTGLYRVGSLVGLAISLAVVAVVLQRFVLRRGDAEPPPPPGSDPSPPESSR